MLGGASLKQATSHLLSHRITRIDKNVTPKVDEHRQGDAPFVSSIALPNKAPIRLRKTAPGKPEGTPLI